MSVTAMRMIDWPSHVSIVQWCSAVQCSAVQHLVVMPLLLLLSPTVLFSWQPHCTPSDPISCFISSLPLFLPHILTLSNSLWLTHVHTHTHTHTHTNPLNTLKHTHTLSFSHPRSLSLSYTQTQIACRRYSFRKVLETWYKGLFDDASKISAVAPSLYAKRLLTFMAKCTA